MAYLSEQNRGIQNVSIAELRDNWVPDEAIIYIGKATSLKSRLGSYLRFGEGKFATHWGGRYIWQLKDSRELLVCWKETDENPRVVEEEMIAQFKKEHGGKTTFCQLARLKRTMKKLNKDILLGLFTSIIIVGIIYGSNVYFSLQESKQRQERHKQEEERREKIKKYREILEKQRDSIRVSGKTSTFT